MKITIITMIVLLYKIKIKKLINLKIQHFKKIIKILFNKKIIKLKMKERKKRFNKLNKTMMNKLKIIFNILIKMIMIMKIT